MLDNKDYVILNGKKYFDDDLDFDDIPEYVEQQNLEIVNEKSSSDGDSSSFFGSSVFKNGISENIVYWEFINIPFGLKSKKLDLFIDLLKIKKIKDLIKILVELQKEPDKYKFNELLLVLDKTVSSLLSKRLKEILLLEPETLIDWQTKIKQENKKIVGKNGVSFEEDEEIVFLKKKLSNH